MKIFIFDLQKVESERLHDTSRNKRVCNCIKTTLLASEGWSSAMIAQALRLHQTTVDHYIHESMNKGKSKLEDGGSDSKLSAEQTSLSVKYLSDNLFHHIHEIIVSALHTWGILSSVVGMNKWLHRNGFSHKKPAGTPHKFNEERQAQFIESMKTWKKKQVMNLFFL